MSTDSDAGTTRYKLRDRHGCPAVHVRLETPDGAKRFYWEQEDGSPGLLGRPVASLPLYGIWRVVDAPADEPVYLTEGEKAADALDAVGLTAVGTVTGASVIPDDEALSPLAGRAVRLWADGDAVGREHMVRIFDQLVELGASPSIVEWVDAPEHGDAADFVEAGHTAADVRALPIRSAPMEIEGWAESIRRVQGRDNVRSAQGSSHKGAERTLRFRTARELAEETRQEVAWIAKPWVASGAITVVDGKVKAGGKTTWVMHLCRSALEGQRFLDELTSQTAVVYLTEQPTTSLKESLRRADLLGRDDFVFLSWSDAAAMAWPDVVAAAVEECEARSARLLVIDTLSRFVAFGGDGENDAGRADAAMAPLQIAAANGLAVIVVRHERKAGGDVGDSGRGSTALGGAADIILAIRRSPAGPNVRKIYGLSRFDETPDAVAIELRDAGYVLLGDDTAVALREVEGALREVLPPSPLPGASIRELVERLGASRTMVQRGLDGLDEAGLLSRDGSGRKGDPYRYALLEGTDDQAEGGTAWTLPWLDDSDGDEYVIGTA